MTYSELITDIGRWMNRTHGEIDTIIAQQIIESQYELEKKAPLWFLVDEYTSVIVSGQSSIKLPNYTIKVLDVEMTDSERVKYPFAFKSLAEVREHQPLYQAVTPETGRPEIGALLGHVIEFAPQSDSTYTMRLRLWHHLDALNTTTNDHNEWTTIYLAALRYHVLVAMSAYIKDDPRIPVWENRLAECINDIKGEVMDAATPNLNTMTCETEDIY